MYKSWVRDLLFIRLQDILFAVIRHEFPVELGVMMPFYTFGKIMLIEEFIIDRANYRSVDPYPIICPRGVFKRNQHSLKDLSV